LVTTFDFVGKLGGLSQPAVTERVKRMEERGVIQEYRTVVSPEKIGKPATAYMLFHTRECTAFLKFCHSAPEVIECHRPSTTSLSCLCQRRCRGAAEALLTLSVFKNSSGRQQILIGLQFSEKRRIFT